MMMFLNTWSSRSLNVSFVPLDECKPATPVLAISWLLYQMLCYSLLNLLSQQPWTLQLLLSRLQVTEWAGYLSAAHLYPQHLEDYSKIMSSSSAWTTLNHTEPHWTTLNHTEPHWTILQHRTHTNTQKWGNREWSIQQFIHGERVRVVALGINNTYWLPFVYWGVSQARIDNLTSFLECQGEDTTVDFLTWGILVDKG